MKQTNVSFSRKGVIRGLHFHERGQDDLFVCLQRHGAGRRPRPRDRRDVHRGHRRREPGRDLRARPLRARLRGAHRPRVRLPRDRGVRPRRSGRARGSLERPARRRPLEHDIADPVGTGQSRILITGAGGQLGAALSEVFPEADARDRARFDVTSPPPLDYRPDLVLHAAAWTDVDGAEADPEGAARVNVEGTRNVVALGAPVVYFSTDYVFDGAQERAVRRVGRAEPGLGVRADEARRRARGAGRAGSSARRGSSAGRARTSSGRCSRSASSRTRCPSSTTSGLAHVRRPPRRSDPRAARAAPWRLASRRRGRLHVGRVRRGDLRRSGPRLPSPPHHERGAQSPRPETGQLSPPQRASRSAAPTPLARRPPRLPSPSQ